MHRSLRLLTHSTTNATVDERTRQTRISASLLLITAEEPRGLLIALQNGAKDYEIAVRSGIVRLWSCHCAAIGFGVLEKQISGHKIAAHLV